MTSSTRWQLSASKAALRPTDHQVKNERKQPGQSPDIEPVCKTWLGRGLAPLGEQAVKNISRAVGVFGLTAKWSAGFWKGLATP
jgi:hypothetical protein